MPNPSVNPRNIKPRTTVPLNTLQPHIEEAMAYYKTEYIRNYGIVVDVYENPTGGITNRRTK